MQDQEPKPWPKGETVVLKSGGPEMTSLGDDGWGKTKVTWFDSNQKVNTQSFENEALETAEARRARSTEALQKAFSARKRG